MDILVTVAVASYNNASYIERCIDSVISQTHPSLEILVIDDGSKDDTLSRIEKYKKDERVIIEQKENGGLSTVRQMALEQAKGEYICFIDADDYLAPSYVERMLNKLIEDKSDICVCSSVFFTEGGERLERSSFICKETLKPIKTTPSQLTISNNLDVENLYLSDSWNKLYKTEVLRSFGVSFRVPKGLNGTDTLFNRLVALHAPSYSAIKDELYIHVIYSKSAVHRKKKDLYFTYRLITQESIKESRKLGIYEEVNSFIETKYAVSLFDVLVDEGKESEGYVFFMQRLKELKKEHFAFSREYGINTSRMSRNCRIVEKVIVFTFQRTTFLLPVLFGMGKLLKKVTSHK